MVDGEKMKKLGLILIILFVLVQIQNAQSGIYKIHGEPFSSYMEFVSEDVGWIVTGDYIKKTQNGGLSWTIQLTFDRYGDYFDDNFTNDVDFLNQSVGYFTKYDNALKHYLYKTINGGDSWEMREIKIDGVTINDVTNLTFLDEQIGYIRFNFSDIAKTSDGGITWEILSEDLENIYKIRFINESIGYYYTTGGIYKSIDGGVTWNKLNTGVTYHYGFDVIGENLWVGADGVYFSSNSGETWSKISSDIALGNNSRIEMIDNQYGFAVSGGYGFFTKDGGNTWESISGSIGLSSFYNADNGWVFQNRALTKIENKMDTSFTIFPDIEFSDVTFADNLRIIASAYNGAIMHSNDGGKTWAINLDLYGKYRIEDLCFGDGGVGIAVGWYYPTDSQYTNGYIARTSNFGENWEVVLDVNEPYGTFIESADYSNGKYFVKSTGKIITSVNSGLNWSIDSTDYAGASFNQTDFIGNTGFAIPNYGNQKLMKTTNGGVGWSSTADENASSVYFVAEDCVWAVFGTKIMKSTDQGQTWIDPELDFYQIYFKTKNLGVGFGYLDNTNIFSDGVYLTEDGGENWVCLSKGYLHYTDWAIDFISSSEGMFCSQRNMYTMQNYGFIDTIAVSVDDNNNSMPSKYLLSQNYPNPFNPSTVIEFSLPQKANVSLKVFNSLGQEVAELINSEMFAGYHSVNFNATNLSSGIYFYRITSGNFTQTNKMLLLK